MKSKKKSLNKSQHYLKLPSRLKIMDSFWYEQNIESPLQRIIWELRNNGINTECSCGHQMYIQCQYIPDEMIKVAHDIVWRYLSKHKKLFGLKHIDFDIIVKHQVRDGHSYSHMHIEFPIKG